MASKLSRFKVAQLRDLARAVGTQYLPTRKDEMASAIAAQIGHHARALAGTDPADARIVSVDVGFRNLAWAYFRGPQLATWQRVTLVPSTAANGRATPATTRKSRGRACDSPPFSTVSASEGDSEVDSDRIYDPSVFAGRVHAFTQSIAEQLFAGDDEVRKGGAPPPPVHFVIERQRMAGAARGSMSIFMVNMVEGMLWSSLLHPAFAGSHASPIYQSLPPGQVSRWFAHGGKEKKRSATVLAQKCLDSKHVMIVSPDSRELARTRARRKAIAQPDAPYLAMSEVIAQEMTREKKKDDLADCLLQGLAYSDWLHNSQNLSDWLDGRSEGAAPSMPSLPLNWRNIICDEET